MSEQTTPSLEELEEYVLGVADATDPADPKYGVYLDHLKKMEEVRNLAHSRRLSKEAILNAVVTGVGLVAVLGYEHFLPITGKAFSLLMKIRL